MGLDVRRLQLDAEFRQGFVQAFLARVAAADEAGGDPALAVDHVERRDRGHVVELLRDAVGVLRLVVAARGIEGLAVGRLDARFLDPAVEFLARVENAEAAPADAASERRSAAPSEAWAKNRVMRCMVSKG